MTYLSNNSHPDITFAVNEVTLPTTLPTTTKLLSNKLGYAGSLRQKRLDFNAHSTTLIQAWEVNSERFAKSSPVHGLFR